MARNSQIEWTHHTFNPWWGCTKVSAACDNCYADAWAKRMGHQLWGAKAQRRFFSDNHWREPLQWNEEAEADGFRHRVFCASMADVFELRAELNPHREKLWALIKATPQLDWLLLTKRPQNVEKMSPWTNGSWPQNVWLGTTVESQKCAEQRLPHLLKHAAAVRFLSCEPLLGVIDLKPWFKPKGFHPIDWVIAGGESGPGARPMNPAWALRLLKDCQKSKTAFHFKQWGHWVPAEMVDDMVRTNVVEFEEGPVRMARLGKKEAGRVLNGATWDEFPPARLVAHA